MNSEEENKEKNSKASDVIAGNQLSDMTAAWPEKAKGIHKVTAQKDH